MLLRSLYLAAVCEKMARDERQCIVSANSGVQEDLWASPHIGRGISAGSRRMVFVSGCRPDGGVRCWHVVEKRGGSSLRCSCHRSTPARKTFSHAQRLSRAVEIESVKRMGKRIKTGHLDVRVAASPFAYARVGIIVPKYKRSIVERNQLRRRLRELVRTTMLPVIPPCDVYIRSMPHAYGVPFDILVVDVGRIVERLVPRLLGG